VRIWEEDAKNNLAWFIEYDGRGLWQPARHLEMLCYKLEAIERGELKRLMVFMPPRHGKSEVVSKKFPAWYLGRNPDKEIIISSYAAELAYDFSRIARNTFREWGPRLWGLNLADDSGAVGRWGIQGHRGGLTAAGVGGPITGRGANVAIIDDPIKIKKRHLQRQLGIKSGIGTVQRSAQGWHLAGLLFWQRPDGTKMIWLADFCKRQSRGESNGRSFRSQR